MAYSEYTIQAKHPEESVPVYHYDCLPSTNINAKERLLNGERRGLVIADTQSAGRGRLGRNFFSASGLFMTWIVSSDDLLIPAQMLTTAAAASVCRAITQEHFDAKIKWVNDIFVNEKKVCGILTEAVSQGSSTIGYVIGIGINIGEQDFPADIASTATSLSNGDPLLDLALKRRLADAVVCNLLDATHARQDDIIEYCEEKSCILGKQIRFFGTKEGVGVAMGLDHLGGLIVRTENGDTLLTGGEISVRAVQETFPNL